MGDSVIEIRRQLDDLLGDNYNLENVKESEGHTKDTLEADSVYKPFHIVEVKTEFEEENEDLSFVTKADVFGADKGNDDEQWRENYNVKEKKKTKRIRQYRAKVKCEQCGCMCRDNSTYKLHLLNHTGERPFKCNLCDKSYKKQMDLTYHMVSHTGIHEIHCKVCRKGFAVNSALKAHMRTHTKEKPYVCPVCGRAFSHHSSLGKHVATHGNERNYECDQCDGRFKTWKTLSCHKQSHNPGEENRVQCAICFKFYKSKESIKMHLKSHQNKAVPEEDRQTYSCELCGNSYKHQISLKNHMRSHTNDRFQCHLCDKSYLDSKSLRVHQRNHTGETPYACEICDRKFKRRDSFVYHKSTHDSTRESYKCDLCDKVLVCKSALRKHHTLVHSTERKYRCELCDQRFKLRYDLTLHMRRHEKTTGVSAAPKEVAPIAESRPNRTLCEICHADCDEKGLEEHMASHDVKPLKCECWALFFSEGEYKRHIREECRVWGAMENSAGETDGRNEVFVKCEFSEGVKEEPDS